MGFFDAINPFSKKEDDILPPLDDNPQPQGQPNLDHSQFAQQRSSFNPNMPQPPQQNPLHQQTQQQGMGQPPKPEFEHPMRQQQNTSQPQQPSDNRMKMPLGDSIRQQRVSAMHESSPAEQTKQHNPLQKELELISSKLDYLKASLDSANQRLAHLEHLTKEEIESKKW